MSRLMVTTIALPSIAARRFSQCSTMNSASRSMRSFVPTSVSSGTRICSATSSPGSVRCCRFRQFFFRCSRAGLVNRQLDDARLVVERLRGPVLDGLTDVIHVRVLPEDMARVPVIALQWRSGETSESRVRQRVSHPASTADHEAVLATVRLVCHDDDIRTLRDNAVRLAELLDRGEHHAPRRAVQQLQKVLSVLKPVLAYHPAARDQRRKYRKAGRPGRCGR